MWRSFEIPPGAKVATARMRISVDNGYRLMLDGRELGTGSDWRSVTEYDISQLLKPGRHVVAVEGFNDNREAGMQFGLKIELKDGRLIEIFSDRKWRVVPDGEQGWENKHEASPNWSRAVTVGELLPRPGEWQQRDTHHAREGAGAAADGGAGSGRAAGFRWCCGWWSPSRCCCACA